ncbi:MAG TPA: hypothetical protein VGX71_05485 [Pseudaminobacter sp.]|nr:hypothetical protein [Pseudaminobacter sp.]
MNAETALARLGISAVEAMTLRADVTALMIYGDVSGTGGAFCRERRPFSAPREAARIPRLSMKEILTALVRPDRRRSQRRTKPAGSRKVAPPVGRFGGDF